MQQAKPLPYSPLIILLTALLLTAVVISSWLLFRSHTKNPISTSTNTTMIDSYMTQISAANYDDRGQLQALFAAAKVEHHVGDKCYHYSQPYITLYTPHGDQWLLTASHGTTNAQLNTFSLVDQVTIAQEQPHHAPLLIHTSQLTLYPHKRLATTDQEVTLNQAKTQLTGHGLEFYWDGDIVLHDPVSMTQADYHLNAQKLHIIRNSQHNISQITATGQPAYFWTTPKNANTRLDAWANTLHYFPTTAKIVLQHHALVQRRNDRITGTEISYDLKQHKILSHGDNKHSVHILLNKSTDS